MIKIQSYGWAMADKIIELGALPPMLPTGFMAVVRSQGVAYMDSTLGYNDVIKHTFGSGSCSGDLVTWLMCVFSSSSCHKPLHQFQYSCFITFSCKKNFSCV